MNTYNYAMAISKETGNKHCISTHTDWEHCANIVTHALANKDLDRKYCFYIETSDTPLMDEE